MLLAATLPDAASALTIQTALVTLNDQFGGAPTETAFRITEAGPSELISEDLSVFLDDGPRSGFATIDRFGNLALGVDLRGVGVVESQVTVFSDEAFNFLSRPARARSFVIVDGGFLQILGTTGAFVSLEVETESSGLAGPAQLSEISLTMDNDFGTAMLTRNETHPFNLEDPPFPLGNQIDIGLALLEIDLGVFDPGERVALNYTATLRAGSPGAVEFVTGRYTDPVTVAFGGVEFVPVDATVPLPASGLLLVAAFATTGLLHRRL